MSLDDEISQRLSVDRKRRGLGTEPWGVPAFRAVILSPGGTSELLGAI